VKKETAYAGRAGEVLQEVRSRFGEASLPRCGTPIEQLVFAFLEWDATRSAAEAGFRRLMDSAVDVNELRVTRTAELAATLGPGYPRAEERAVRLRESLQDVFLREYGTSLDTLGSKGKKEIREYLQSLRGAPLYAAWHVALLCYEVHSVPVDEGIRSALAEAGAADPSMSAEQVSGFLERQVKAGEALRTFAALRAWADERLEGEAASTGEAAANAPADATRNGAEAGRKRRAGGSAKPSTRKATTKKKAASSGE
jgi:hypothetical protein